MTALRRLGRWFARLVHRPAELFEVASSCGTIGLVGIALVNHGNPRVVPSLSLLAEIVPEPVWLLGAGAAALLQLFALHMDDPEDQRHPFLQPQKWVRSGAAAVNCTWYLILIWAVGISVGLNHVQAMYAMAAGMNLYIVAHVLVRVRE
jgi:hypothetical protein